MRMLCMRNKVRWMLNLITYMKKLLFLSLFLCGCSAAYRQRKDIEKQHQLNYQYQNELAKDCVRLFPVKDSVGTPIISKSNNIDYSHGIDSLKNYIDSAKRFYDPLFSISDDNGKLRRTVLLQASQLNVLSSKINALKSAYKPCKPDTIKIPYYRVDDAKVNTLQYALKIKSDSLIKVNALKSKSQKEINTWRWAAIIAILIIFGFVVIKVYALINGGWIKNLLKL